MKNIAPNPSCIILSLCALVLNTIAVKHCYLLVLAANPCDNPSPCDDVNGYCNLVNGTEDCSCKRGYTLSAQNSSICDEIDECLLGIDACAQLCTNTIGGYACTCNAGYTISSNRLGCDGKWCTVLYCTTLYCSVMFYNVLYRLD